MPLISNLHSSQQDSVQLTRLWTKPQNISEFSAQTLTITGLNQYPIIAIEFIPSPGTSTAGSLYFFSMHGRTTQRFCGAFSATNGTIYIRGFTVNTNNNTIYFETGYCNGDAGGLTGSKMCIPLNIYGVSGVSFI